MLYRRFIALALICLCVLAPSLPTGQAKLMMEKNISIFVDGEQLLFPDQQPFIDQHHRTLVPVRFFAQALGASVEWQALQKQVLIRTSDKTLLYIAITRAVERLYLTYSGKSVFTEYFEGVKNAAPAADG